MKKLLFVVMILVLVLTIVAPVYADDNLGPCNDGTERVASTNEGATGQNYAEHHIVPLAENGDTGKVDHDGDGVAHVPGAHQGFSRCVPQAQSGN